MTTLLLQRSNAILPIPLQRSDTLPPHPTCKGCFDGSLKKEDHYGVEGCKNMYRDEEEDTDIDLSSDEEVKEEDQKAFDERISKCPGCIDNEPNQLAHMDSQNGCLWSKMLEEI